MESSLLSGEEQRSFANLTRLRLNAEASPLSWFRFTVQLQDARGFAGTAGSSQDNHVEAQHAFADFGRGEEGRWNLRIGRQPLAFGDERLIGADSSWHNVSRRFDGVRGTVRTGEWQWDVFSASPVEVLPTRVDRFNRAERLSGIYGRWTRRSGAALEPYLLWKRARPQAAEADQLQHYDLWTPGLRISTPVGLGFKFVTEMALQRGRQLGVPVSARAGYWEVGRRLGQDETAPRLTLSYSHASGDRNAAAGRKRLGTFNDLNPAGYNACGFLEPFSWRNIRDLRLGTNWSLPHRWRLTAELHGYWLATVKDGVYVDEGPYVAYNPAAPSSRLGNRVLATAQRGFGSHFDLAFGYAKFFPAAYMKHDMSLSHNAFVSWTLHM